MMTNKDIELQVSWLVWFIGVQWASSALLTGLASAQTTVTLTSSVEQAGRQVACPGEEVTFTCTVTEGGALQWIAEPHINQSNPVIFSGANVTAGETRDPTPQIHIVLDDVNPGSDPRLRDFVSTLTVRNSTALSGTVIQCSSGRNTISNSLIIGTPPSSPQNATSGDVGYRKSDFTVAVQWESPASDGGVGIDNYTLTGAGITDLLTLLSNEPLMATLTLSYNEMHMVSITASNCAGESTATVVTIHEVGCGPPTPPPRGSLGDLTNSQEGAVVTFQCNPELVPSQQMISVCAPNGSWTPDPAELVCREPADCGDPSPPVNGFVMAYGSTLEGALIVFQCSPGFAPSQQRISVCMADGRWSPDPAELVCMSPPPGDCGVPASPINGTVAYTTTTEGSLVTFQCSAGLVPVALMAAVCEESGGGASWSPDPGDLSCSMPTITDGGLSTAEAVGITFVLSSIVAFSAGLLVALVIAYCYIRQLNSKGQYSPRDPQQPAPMTLYEDITTATSKNIEMKENVAYGPIGR